MISIGEYVGYPYCDKYYDHDFHKKAEKRHKKYHSKCYVVINKRGGKITKIYDIFDNEYEAKQLSGRLCYHNLTNSQIKYYMKNDIRKSIERVAGLPELICINTNKIQRVIGMIYSGQYEIIQEYEYLLIA